MNRKRLNLLMVVTGFLLSGCTVSLIDTFQENARRPFTAVEFFRQLDSEVKTARVTDVANAAIAGFPYLRTNRFQAALKNRLTTPEREKEWLQALQRLDLEARANEIHNLPLPVVERLHRHYGIEGQDLRAGLIRAAETFSNTLLQHDRQQSGFLPAVISAAEVPDDYSIWMRTFGIYPLFVPPIAYFTDKTFDKMRERNRQPLIEQKSFGKAVGYVPPTGGGDSVALTTSLFQKGERDAFGLPKLSGTDKEQMALAYAPVFNIDVADTFDHLGAVMWDGDKLSIDAANPVVYYYFSNALWKGEPIWQINYVFWTSGRLGPNAPYIERGELDGIALRVSLDQEGIPLLVDGMNNCGCFHFYIPNQDRLLRVIPTSFNFDPVVIDFLPQNFPAKPLAIKVISGWHQVADVGTDLPAESEQPYRLLPYEHLESLPRSPNEFASMFDQEGIAIGSDRIEPYLFFAMGIPRVGAMRQRGHHPTKLIGRAHFDDPALIDSNFEFK